jgi:hypothetical protein
MTGNAAFCLGDWRIDPALDEISRDGKTIKLEPRTMRVLVCFAERPGEVVSVNGLVLLKTDPLMDPLRNEPRFQAIERQLKFPS